jgi:hypothetical protein
MMKARGAPAMAMSMMADAGGDIAAGGGNAFADGGNSGTERMVVRTGTVNVWVEDVAAARERVAAAAAAAGGMLVRSSANGDSSATVTVRVPAPAFDDVSVSPTRPHCHVHTDISRRRLLKHTTRKPTTLQFMWKRRACHADDGQVTCYAAV